MVFGTLAEARACAAEIARNTGYILAVTETRAKVTHTYNLEEGQNR